MLLKSFWPANVLVRLSFSFRLVSPYILKLNLQDQPTQTASDSLLPFHLCVAFGLVSRF